MFPIKDSIRSPISPVVVYALIAVNTAVFIYQSYQLSESASHIFSLQHALVPLRYFDTDWARQAGLDPKDYWPFLTGIFMHGSWWHLILNMWTLYIFGSSLEGRVRSLPFLAFYLLCGLIASLTHAYFNADSDVPALGASGAIAGVMGGYATTFPRARLTLLVPIIIIPLLFKIPALAFALIWFGLQFLQGFAELISPSMGGGIAWWAHVGGFLAGVLLIPLWRLTPDLTYDEDAPHLKKPVAPEPQGYEPGPWG
jgi:membrane associated rhomboid family serine protease